MKLITGLLALFLFSGCTCTTNLEYHPDQDFLSDLGSENNRIAGDLYLDYFDQDLSGLTYDYYLTFITKNEAPSAERFSTIVKNADYHYFISRKEFFVIALYYKKENTIICDNSDTSFLDSLKVYHTNDSIPELSQFARTLIK